MAGEPKLRSTQKTIKHFWQYYFEKKFLIIINTQVSNVSNKNHLNINQLSEKVIIHKKNYWNSTNFIHFSIPKKES